MSETAVTPSPGFISISVGDVDRSARFYETTWAPSATPLRSGRVLSPLLAGHIRPEFGPRSAAVAESCPIQLWWRASDAQALFERATADGVRILQEPFDGPFGRTFAMADPDGYRVTVYEKDQPLFWPPRPPK